MFKIFEMHPCSLFTRYISLLDHYLHFLEQHRIKRVCLYSVDIKKNVKDFLPVLDLYIPKRGSEGARDYG